MWAEVMSLMPGWALKLSNLILVLSLPFLISIKSPRADDLNDFVGGCLNPLLQ
jgi:hypothetical protein